MSMQRALLASVTLIAAIGAASDAAAQAYDRQRLERQRYQTFVMRPVARQHVLISGQPKPRRPVHPAPVTVRAATPAPAQRPAVQSPRSPTHVHRPAARAETTPPVPLTEEQIAAKAAVEQLLSREPALAVAAERPDPEIARAAAARHDAEQRRAAAQLAKEEAAAKRRAQIAERGKPGKQATPKRAGKQEPNSQRSAAAVTRGKRTSATGAVAAAYPEHRGAPQQPLRRMPMPN